MSHAENDSFPINMDKIFRKPLEKSTIERKILDSFPFFGGTTPETTAGTSGDPKAGATTDSKQTGGGVITEDPIAALQADPNKLRDLLNQVNKLSKDHESATNALTEIERAKEKEARAQMNKEQQLSTDLENANLQIEKMTAVVQNMAVQNAFITRSGDIQWNSIKQAMAELVPDNYSVNIDLDNGMAEVDNIDQEVKRIAKDFPWLVKSAGTPDPNAQQAQGPRGPGRPRTTGLPPAGVKGNEGKKARRDEMMQRFPVLMNQR